MCALDPEHVQMPERRRRTAAVILAAGRGNRLKSNRPKVLHPVCGRPSIWHVLNALRGARPERVVVIVHHGREKVEEAVRSFGITPEPVFIEQGEPLGTGHAVMAAEEAVGDAEEVLVMSGDEPLHTADSLKELLKRHRRTRAAVTLMTTELPDASGYGRVIRNGEELVRIAEERDATPHERAIHHVATMVYAFQREALFGALPLVDRNNRQHEYYLPDVLSILKGKGEVVGVMPVDLGGILGINTRWELSQACSIMWRRIAHKHMDSGVSILDPATTYIDASVRIGRDTVIHPHVFLEGSTAIGTGCEIGPSARLVDSRVGDHSQVQFAVVRGSRVGRSVAVGPFASIRPGTVLADGSKAGTFVEIKASRVGKGSKVPHLSYVGDAKIGSNTNVGAATVTVNYDGWDKHPTVIGDDAKIGSDTMLVAPVKVGKGAMTGAGSVITRDVPPGALGIERSEQRNIPGFRARKEGAKRGAKGDAPRRRAREER